jgi:hypothetical protein
MNALQVDTIEEEDGIKEFFELRDKNFKRLMSNRASIRKNFEGCMKKLLEDLDVKLQENYKLLQQLGMPEEQMPLAPESNQNRIKRIAEGKERKLSEMEIKRVLNEMMEPKKFYVSSQLIDFLQISYKDFIEFYQKNGQDQDDKNLIDKPFFFSKGKNKWRKYRINESKSGGKWIKMDQKTIKNQLK